LLFFILNIFSCHQCEPLRWRCNETPLSHATVIFSQYTWLFLHYFKQINVLSIWYYSVNVCGGVTFSSSGLCVARIFPHSFPITASFERQNSFVFPHVTKLPYIIVYFFPNDLASDLIWFSPGFWYVIICKRFARFVLNVSKLTLFMETFPCGIINVLKWKFIISITVNILISRK